MLRVAMQTFSRQATTVLTTTLRAVCQITPARLEELSYDEYLSSIPDQSMCAVLSLEPLQGKALLNIDHTTLLLMIDYLLGGPGTDEQPDRPLTEIEQSLIRQPLGRMLRELAYAMDPMAKVTPVLVSLENNAQFVQAAAPTDPVVVWHLELQIGSRASPATLCFPYSMLSNALEELSRDAEDEDQLRVRREAAARTTSRLAEVSVNVSVRFTPSRLPSSRIADLRVGDVLPLGHRTTTPLEIVSAATTFAHAVPGISGRKVAVRVVEPPETPRNPGIPGLSGLGLQRKGPR